MERAIEKRQSDDMRQARRPTRRQKEIIKGKNLNLANWLVVEQTKEQLTIMHRHTGKLREIRLQ